MSWRTRTRGTRKQRGTKFKSKRKGKTASKVRIRGAAFYFSDKKAREKAYELLSQHNFYFPYGSNLSMKEIDDPDYMLELLESEGFDISQIRVER